MAKGFAYIPYRTGPHRIGSATATEGTHCPTGPARFGGLSLAVPDPTAAAPQPVYATAHLFWGGPSRLRTQVVYRLDTGVLPALHEPGT